MVMANRRAQNIIKNVESDTKTAFPSDHFPVNLRVKIILTKHKRGNKKPAPTWKSPVPGFNAELRKQYRMETQNNSTISHNKETINAKVEAFQKSILAVAELYVDKRPRDEKEHTRSPELESLFNQRQIAKDEGWYELTKPYTQKIRRLLKKERLDEKYTKLRKGPVV